MKKFVRKSIIIIVVAFIGVMLFLYYASYSDGYRAGVPIKISHKGKIIKTYEGEINEGGLTNSTEGVMPSKWEFSIRSKDAHVLESLNEAIESNSRVKLFYTEKYVALPWLGETKYFVYDVKILE